MVYSLRADMLMLVRDVMGAKVSTQLAAYDYFRVVEKQINRHHDSLEPYFF
jgi:predicted SnoaL-like aldol condensation-catalyzing enzyme